MGEPITFSATLTGVKLMPDGCWRLTFDVPSRDAASVLETAKLLEQSLTVAVLPNPPGEPAETPRWG